MAQSSVPGPVPLPMARMRSNPASRARTKTWSRSESNLGPSRCACESMYMGWRLFQLGSHGHIFQKAGQNWLAIFAHRCRHDHAVGLKAAKLAGLQIGHDHD